MSEESVHELGGAHEIDCHQSPALGTIRAATASSTHADTAKTAMHSLFETGSCADLWRNYTEALAKRRQEEIHLYLNRQEELASQAATPQQIADLNKLKSDLQAQTTKLQKQMQEVRRLRRQGIEETIGIGVGGLLI